MFRLLVEKKIWNLAQSFTKFESFLQNFSDQPDDWESNDPLLLGLKDHVKEDISVQEGKYMKCKVLIQSLHFENDYNEKYSYCR